MKKNLLIGLVLIVVLGLGMTFPTGHIKVERVVENVGATPTLDGVDSPFVRIGGYGEYYYSQAIAATSSVPCSIKITATSTLVNYSVIASTNTFNTTFDISTSTSPFLAVGSYGSSSPAFVRAYATPNAVGFAMVWTGNGTTTSAKLVGTAVSANVGNTDNIIFPGQYLNMTIASTSPGTFAAGYMTGRCNALLQTL